MTKTLKQNKDYLKIIKTISNPSRTDIILLLHNSKKEMCVNEISTSLKMSQSLTSHQLKYLESRDILMGKRMGQTICYELCKNEITKRTLKAIKAIIE